MRGALAFGLLLTTAAGPAPEGDIAVGWLDGRWVEQSADGSWTEENWSSARGGAMLGTSKSGAGARLDGFEYMRIVREDDGLVFYGSPSGKPAIAFRERRAPVTAANICETQVVFENRAHDFPKRIAYRRFGNRLTATVSNDEAGRDGKSWTFARVE